MDKLIKLSMREILYFYVIQYFNIKTLRLYSDKQKKSTLIIQYFLQYRLARKIVRFLFGLLNANHPRWFFYCNFKKHEGLLSFC